MKIKVLQVIALSAIVTLVWGESSNAFPEPQQQAGSQQPAKQASRQVITPMANVALMDKNSYGQLPMQFEKNQGQTDSRVQFLARGGGYTLFLSPEEAVFSLRPPKLEKERTLRAGRKDRRQLQALQPKKASVLRMKLADGNLAPTFEGTNQLPGSVNYLIGKDPSKWQIGIPVFTGVRVLNVYPKIDMVYYGNSHQLEYDFVVNPGADPSRIVFEFQGATGVSLTETGEVQIDSQAGRVTIHKPSIYQMEHGLKKIIDGNFAMRDGRKVGVEVKNYDRTKPLVVDPVLAYSTYLGGSGQDSANDIAVDSQGYAYVTGDTSSVDFPTVSPAISSAPNGTTIGFVSKLNQTGTALVYSTYLGGTTNDSLQGIAVDGAGQVYVTGMTASTDFPVTSANAFQVSYGLGATLNAFVAKISADGRSLLYSTYLGGNSDDEGTSIAVDANQNAYVAGYTSSSTFPVTAAKAFQSTLNSPNGNGFIARIDTTQTGNNSLIYSTFLGGSSPYSMAQLPSGSFGGDGVLGIAIDSSQNAYVVGDASSADFPLTASKAFQTAGSANNSVFLTRLDTSKSGASGLIYSTFLGGTGPYGDLGSRVALDSLGNTYITGDAFSMDFPTTVGATNSANGKAFVVKFNTNLSGAASLIYSTLVGGSGGEQAFAIAVDPDGDACIGGDTGSTDFPVTSGAVQSTLLSSSWNGFIAELSSEGSTFTYGSYFGGSGIGSGDHVHALAIDSNANVYFAGQTDSTDIPTTSGVLQTTLGGSTNSFVGKLTGIVTPSLSSLSPSSASVGDPVTIRGANLGITPGASTITFNGTPATVTSWTNNQIVVPVPVGASTGPLLLMVQGISLTAASQFGVISMPLVTSVSPDSGLAGVLVTIIGSNFGISPGTVTFNGRPGTPTSWSPGSIKVPVPTGASTGNIVVTVGGMSSAGTSFTVPTLATLSLAPASASIAIGQTFQFVLTGTYTDGTQLNVSSSATWSSYATNVATIDGAGLVTAVAKGQTAIQAAIGSLNASGIAAVVNQSLTGSLPAAMGGNTLSMLDDGTVLAAGGYDSNGQSLTNASIYSSASSVFVATGNLNAARSLHTATVLNDGTVLIVGGFASGGVLASAEIYSPPASVFITTGVLNVARSGHTATMLPSGKILIAGGADGNGTSLSSAELYDPATGTFAVTGSLHTARQGDTATLLSNGMVLISGGVDASGNFLQSAELYNPTAGTFASAGNMVSQRALFTSTLLNSGLVLIAGGVDTSQSSLASTELYNPATGTFSASGSMNSPRSFFTATLLNNGAVLLAGGLDAAGNVLASQEYYDPVTGTFTLTSNFVTPRYTDTAILLNNGNVLAVGGLDGSFNRLASAELYQPSTLTPTRLVSISINPSAPTIPLGANQPFIATGTFSDGSTQTLASVVWNSASSTIAIVSNDPSNSGMGDAVGVGSSTITACTGSICGSSAITVPAPSLVFITLSPQGFAIPLGMTQQVSAIGTYTDGSVADLTATATWSSSSSATAVNSSGLVTGASLGTSIIQASSGTVSSSINVTVGAPVLASLALTPSTGTVFSGASLQFQLAGTYTDGSTRNLTNSAAWFAVPSQTASVNSGGFTTGVAPGTATITVVTGALFASANLTVQAPGATSLVTIVVTPNRASIPVGSNQQFIATGNYSDGSAQDITPAVTWTSSNSAGASVNSTGLAAANSQGSSTLSASSGGITGNAIISVTSGTFALNTDRYQHSATLLNNGSVLFAGGLSCSAPGTCTYLNSAELYDPISGSVTFTGGLSVARLAPAVLLGNGKVLVAGGYSCDVSGNCASLSSTEIYDPNSGVFSGAGNMTIDRTGHTMTLLATGKVLIAGGQSCASASTCNALTTAELFDPVAGTFTATGSLGAARYNASAAVLSNGKVLIVGGFNGVSYPANAELYDPASGTFSVSGALHTPRANATATWLELGGDMIVIAGGSTCVSQACPTASTEYYQGGNIYTLGNMAKARQNETATLLTNGQLFIAGGLNSCVSGCVSDATSTLYNPQTFSFTSSQSLATARAGHTATLLTDGSVLLAGGINNGVTLSSTELYQPPNLTLPQLASIFIAPSNTPVQIGSTLSLAARAFDTSGNYLGPLTAVNWNSSSPSIAGVSNATGSAGIVNALSRGTTVITASVGTISSTTTITVTPVLLSISVIPANTVIPLNSTQSLRLTATGNYSDGTSSNLTPYAVWTNSNKSAITLVPNGQVPGADVLLIPVAVGSSTLAASFNGQTGSSTVTVVAPPTIVAPSINSVSPTSGAAGTQVTILGSGFGMNPGASTVWLGTTLGNVVSWNDSQVIATVATGSATGVAQIHQGAVASNAVPFTVNTPSILSVTPASGTAGTQVTVSGSGFGLGQGTVWLGNAAGLVSQWNDSVIVATVAPGAASGNAQVLQNGVWSNAVPFTINVPHVATVTPNSGQAGTAVIITGNGFGPQVTGIAWIGNSSAAGITKWTDSEIDASVAPGSMTGIVKVQQNGIWSNALTFTVTGNSGSSTPVTLNPNLLTLQVGEIHSIQALDASAKPVKGLTWTSSNTSVATLSTDDPPTINALSVGYTTITAGDASADITVLASGALPLGTVICKNPGTGPGVVSIIPAVPSPTGVADVFALQQDGTVLAVTSDCQTAWAASVGTGNNLIPDFQGGLVVANGQSIYKLDGITGQAYPTYSSSAGNTLTTPAVHTDGTIFTVDGDRVVGLDPLAGHPKFSVHMDDGITNSITIVGDRSLGGCYSSPLPQAGGSETSSSSPPSVGNMIIAGDGYAYLTYGFAVDNSLTVTDIPGVDMLCTSTFSETITSHLRLLRVGAQGDSYVTSLTGFTWSTYTGADHTVSTTASGPNQVMATPITNADTGILLAWADEATGSGPFCPPGTLLPSGCRFATSAIHLLTTSGTQIASHITLNMAASFLQPTLQRADGSYIGTDGVNMYAFTASGTPLWTVPNDIPQIATADRGVIGASGITYDENGNANGKIVNLNQSWNENTYQLGSVERVMLPPIIPPAPSYWSFSNANQSGNHTSPVCRDNRDKLIAEYTEYDAGFVPICFASEFVSSKNAQLTAHFSFNELNQDDIMKFDFPDWAILQSALRVGLEEWRSQYGQPLKITSGYRSPRVQNSINPAAPRDRHIHGDAADVASSTTTWRSLRAAAWSAQACVEPYRIQRNYNHVHSQWKKPCPLPDWAGEAK
jgi:hypothetical protein